MFYCLEKQTWLRWDYDLHSFSLKNPTKKSDEEVDGHIETLQEENTTIELSSVLIPTEDTLRYTFILKALTHHSFPVLFIGETGTSKTSTIKKYLSALKKEEWEQGQMVFSATATAN